MSSGGQGRVIPQYSLKIKNIDIPNINIREKYTITAVSGLTLINGDNNYRLLAS